MKKYLLMLVALFSLALYSCTDKAANGNKANNVETTETIDSAQVATSTDSAETAETTKTAVTTDGALLPTGDVDKDAKASFDFMIKAIEETDFNDKASMKKLDEVIKTTKKNFETYYSGKGEKQLKEFQAAYKKVAGEVNLEDLIAKKINEVMTAK